MLQNSSPFDHVAKTRSHNNRASQFSHTEKNNSSRQQKRTSANGRHLFYLEDVGQEFDHIQALKNVELAIDKGEIVFITGASGAGKTTLLRILSGEMEPQSGKVIRPEESGPKAQFLSKVFQDLRLMPKWSIDENLDMAFDSSAYRNRKEFEADKQDIAKVLGFQDRLHLKIYQANGGLKQKVAITRALLTKPDIFMADEPTSSLDSDNAQRIFDVLNLYNNKKGMTVIWASHNKELVKRFTGRIVHLDKGHLVYSGHACFI